MRPNLIEVAYALYGAWRLLRGDRDGLQFFDDDAPAFWKSFWAAAIVAPGYAILVAFHLSRTPVAADWASVAIVHALAYSMTWTAFPLAAFYVASGMDRAERWTRFVVALNWSKVLQLVLYLPLAALAASGVAGPGGSALLTFAGLAVTLVYQWYVTKVSLDLAGAPAAGLTGIDLVLGILITAFADAALAG